MRSLKSRIRRLQQKAEEGGVLIHQRDGSVRVFDAMVVQAEMFLARCDLFRNAARESDVLDAVRSATPKSRRKFEEKYGPIRIVVRVVGSASGWWVEQKVLTEDGEVLRVFYEGDSEEAALVRERPHGGKAYGELPLPPVAGRWVNGDDEDLSKP
jgi:hypothetical protein